MNTRKVNNDFFSSIPLGSKIDFHLRFVAEHFLGVKPLIPYFNRKSEEFQRRITEIPLAYAGVELHVDEYDASVDTTLLRRCVKEGRPFVVRGGASSWEAFEKWDFDFFRNQYGTHEVILSNHKDIGSEGGAPEVTDLADIIDGLSQKSKKYARFNPLLDVYPELQKSLNQKWLDEIRQSDLLKHHVLFIGNKGTKTDVHCAGNENIFVHIRGTKKWSLWDQRAMYLLNPKVNRGPAKASDYDPHKSNAIDNGNKIPRYDVTCHEGDIIYIPSYLWHHVHNLTPTIGVGNRWLRPASTMKNNSLFAVLELFNTNPSVFKTWKLSKGLDFNKILMNDKQR